MIRPSMEGELVEKDAIRFPNAPIVEALIDIRVGPLPGERLAELKLLAGDVSSDYPIAEERQMVRGELEAGGEVQASVQQKRDGYRFLSADRKQIFQARLNGFTFNKLAPYDRWETFSTEASRLWTLYRSKLESAPVERVSTRFINRIHIPADSGWRALPDYFEIYPKVPDQAADSAPRFLVQMDLPNPDIGAIVTVSQATSSDDKVGKLTIVLDIEATASDLGVGTDAEIWVLLNDHLRDMKNKAFLMCVTEKTKEMFC